MPVTKPLRNSNREPTSLYKVLDGVKKAQKTKIQSITQRIVESTEIRNCTEFLLSSSSSNETDSLNVKKKKKTIDRINRVKNIKKVSSRITDTLIKEEKSISSHVIRKEDLTNQKENVEPTFYGTFLQQDISSIKGILFLVKYS